jgi:hypothetical protein
MAAVEGNRQEGAQHKHTYTWTLHSTSSAAWENAQRPTGNLDLRKTIMKLLYDRTKTDNS